MYIKIIQVKKDIVIVDESGKKIVLEDIKNTDKIEEFLLNPQVYLKHRDFYQNISEEKLKECNYFHDIDLDDENTRYNILNNININIDTQNIPDDKDLKNIGYCLCLTKCCCCCNCCKPS